MSTLESKEATKLDRTEHAATKQSSVLFVLPKTTLVAGDELLAKTFLSLIKQLSGSDSRQVTFLIVDHGQLTKAQKQEFNSECSTAGISIQYLIADKYMHLVGPKSACDSYLFYQWLSENDRFDVVHIPEWMGYAYFALLSKHQGLKFHRTHFVINLHGPSFLRASVEQVPATVEFLAVNFLEKESLRLADSVFSPLPIFFELLKANAWPSPERAYSLQLPAGESAGKIYDEEEKADGQNGVHQALNEIVYLGAIDERDGLSSFCDVLDQLTDSMSGKCQISFCGTVSSPETKTYIENRAQHWRHTWQFHPDQNQNQTLDSLRSGNKLVFVGGTTTASLLIAIKSSLAGLAFLCNSLIVKGLNASPTIPQESMFSDDEELSLKIKQALLHGVSVGKQESVSTHHRQWWKDAHQTIFLSPDAVEHEDGSHKEKQPLVSVCLAHYNRPHFLAAALQSLNSQDYKNLEVIVGDDGSNKPGVQEALDKLQSQYTSRNWKILRLPHRNVGATRTSIAAEAKGEYLLFMDDDNIALPEEISTLVKVSVSTRAAVVTSAFDAFSGDESPAKLDKPLYRKIFLGEAIECGLTENVFGDANALIKRSLFFELGGFDDEPGVAWQDWDFFAKAIIHGAHLEAVPEALYLYRVAANSMNRSSSEWRSAQSIIRQYEKIMPKGLKPLPAMIYGLSKQPATNADGQRSIDAQGSGDASPTSPTSPAPPAPAAALNQTAPHSSQESQPHLPGASEQPAGGAIQDPSPSSSLSLTQRLRANRVAKIAWWLCTMQLPAKVIARQKRIKQIATSPLFDAQWYRKQYAIGDVNPVHHYLAVGASHGFDPGPKFNSRWYRERYPDSQSSSLTPLEHFIEIGIPLHRIATPEEDPLSENFDATWYMQRHPDLASILISPFVHYVLFGQAEGRTPNERAEPLFSQFDADWYCSRYPEANVQPDNAFLDYCVHGRGAGRSINSIEEERNTFNADWYMTRYPEVADTGMEPFEHFLQIGKQKGHAPFAEADPDAKDFDNDWYCHRYPDIEESSVPPLLHYLLYGRREGRLKRPVDGPNSVASALNQRFPDQTAMRMFTVPKAPKQITLVLDNLDSGSLLGRKGTALIFSVLWCQRLQTKLRIVTHGTTLLSSRLPQLLAFHGIALPKSVEFVSYEKGDENSQLPSSTADLFISSSWQNTASLLKTIPGRQIVYLLQEDERLLLGGHDDVLRCSEVLSNKEIRLAVNSSLLYEYLISDGFEHIKKNGAVFEPAFAGSKFHRILSESKALTQRKNFFFYARPDRSSTLYYRGLEVIATALEQNILDASAWEFYFVGTKPSALYLPAGITPQIIEQLESTEYAKLAGSMDLALSLMQSPHPGYPTLELAASGAVVVSNCYANKTSLQSYSRNIICAEPSIEKLTQALAQGAHLATDEIVRSNNYAQNDIEKDWTASFQAVFKKLS